jgi:hypothetical protein
MAYNTRYIDTVGDGSGARDMKVNGSVTPVKFKLKPSAGQIFMLNAFNINYVMTSGNPNVGFGAASADLTNGISIQVLRGSTVVLDLTDGVLVKANHDWKNLCYEEHESEYGTTESALSYCFDFRRGGESVVLEGVNGDEFVVTINDNLTTAQINLLHMYIRVHFIQN